MRRVLLAVAVLALWPATAQAGWQIDRATVIAEHVWRTCPGALTVRITPDVPANVDQMAAGWADEGGCVVNLNANSPMLDYWETFCTEVLHETGHAARFRDSLNLDPQHSHNPNSVMYAHQVISRDRTTIAGRVSVQWTGTDRRCRDRGRPYMEREGLIPPARR